MSRCPAAAKSLVDESVGVVVVRGNVRKDVCASRRRYVAPVTAGLGIPPGRNSLTYHWACEVRGGHGSDFWTQSTQMLLANGTSFCS